MGCDGLYTPQLPSGWIFQSTHPVWDATITSASERTPHIFQSTHPVWDATRQFSLANPFKSISIHASRMGCDYCALVPGVRPANFNPRIPYGMRHSWRSSGHTRLPISIHASRMGCDHLHTALVPVFRISIHASRMGCDVALSLVAMVGIFQSTHPVWDATQMADSGKPIGIISIHASRMGCDKPTSAPTTAIRDFNPRIPYGMRHGLDVSA